MLELFLNYTEKYPFTILESLCVFIPILIGISRWSKLTKPLKLVVAFFVIVFIFDIALWITALQRIHNYHWANAQEFIGSSFFMYIVHRMLDKFTKKWLFTALIIYSLLAIYDFKWDDYSALIFAYPRFVFIFLSFLFFYQLLSQLEIKNLLSYSQFWIFTGLILSCAGTLLMFVFSNYFSHTQGTEVFDKVTMIKDSFKYVYVLLYSFALCVDNKFVDNKL